MLKGRRLGAALAALGVIGLGLTAAPGSARAWWAGGWGWHGGVSVGVALPPVVVAPPPYYVAPPVAYAAPPPVVYAPPPPRGPVWVPGHWQYRLLGARPLAVGRQNVTTVLSPNTAALPTTRPDPFGFRMLPPGLKMYWKSGCTTHQGASCA